MDNKFICPKCGGNIRYWQEYSFTKTKNINPKTGKPVKTVRTSKPEISDGLRGFECCKCDWSEHECLGDIPNELDGWRSEHYENIKELT
jgi:hypothetical protein